MKKLLFLSGLPLTILLGIAVLASLIGFLITLTPLSQIFTYTNKTIGQIAGDITTFTLLIALILSTIFILIGIAAYIFAPQGKERLDRQALAKKLLLRGIRGAVICFVIFFIISMIISFFGLNLI